MNDSLSSGQIAKYCGVHLRTVIRWIEQGYLKGYKLPGRGNNRVLKSEFIHFLEKNELPIPDDLEEARIKKYKSILIVEDDLSMANAIKRILRNDNWRTLHANDGFQAGLMLAQNNIDLITLDLMMPSMNGFAVLKVLNEDEKLKQIPVVVISGSSDNKLLEAEQLGAAATLSKPFDNQQLFDLVSRLIGQSE